MFIVLISDHAMGFTADRVQFEFWSDGTYRIFIRYINLEKLEYQEAWVFYTSKQEAQKVFNMLIKGVDFYFGPTSALVFKPPEDQLKPLVPW